MASDLLFLLLAGVLLLGSVVFLRLVAGQHWRHELVAYALRFPRDLDPAAAVAFLAGLSSLVAPRWQRQGAARTVLETTASTAGISHHLLVPRSLSQLVLDQLRAALPNATVTEDPTYHHFYPNLAGELGLCIQRRTLRVDQPERVASAILASLQPLAKGEAVVVQWVITPVGPVPRFKHRFTPVAPAASSWWRT